MGEAQSKPVFIIAANGGCVCEKKGNGIMNMHADSSNKAQQWIIEPDPSNSKKMAFKNVSDGKYLRAMTGAAGGKMDTGDKQWWTLEQGHAPGSSWIKCTDYNDAYLCNAWAKHTPNNVVYTWPGQVGWTHSMLWYFRDCDDKNFSPIDVATAAAAAGGDPKKAEELKQREVALAEEKEKRQKEFEQREAALKKREQEVQAQEAAQRKQSEQLAEKEKELVDKKPPPPNDGEAKKRQDELQKKLDAVREAERKLAAREAAADKAEQQNSSKAAELKTKENELASEKVAGSGGGAGGGDGVSKEQYDQAVNEKVKLQVKIKQLEAQLAKASDPAKGSLGGRNRGKDTSSEDLQMAKLQDENARMKNLIAQQVLQKFSPMASPMDQQSMGGSSPRPGSMRPRQPGGAGNARPASSGNGRLPAGTHSAKWQDQIRKDGASVVGSSHEVWQNGRLVTSGKQEQVFKGSQSGGIGGSGAKANSSALRAGRPGSDAEELERLKKENARLQAENDRARTAGTKPKHVSTKQPSALDRLKAENAVLKQDHEDLAKGRAGGPGKVGGNAALGSAAARSPKERGKKDEEQEEDAHFFNCGHVAYPPPRKIRKNMVGYLYEQ